MLQDNMRTHMCEPDPDRKTNPTLHGRAVIKSSFLNIWTSITTKLVCVTIIERWLHHVDTL